MHWGTGLTAGFASSVGSVVVCVTRRGDMHVRTLLLECGSGQESCIRFVLRCPERMLITEASQQECLKRTRVAVSAKEYASLCNPVLQYLW